MDRFCMCGRPLKLKEVTKKYTEYTCVVCEITKAVANAVIREENERTA